MLSFIMSDAIDGLVREIRHAGLAGWWEIRGCWEGEIKDLERFYGIKLPALYRAFLKRMGRGAGRYGRGTDMFYKHLFDNRAGMEEVLELDGNPFPLTPTEYVFCSHQGYIFFYFETDPLFDDPPVYGYKEGQRRNRLVDTSLSAFLFGLLEDGKTFVELVTGESANWSL